MFTMLALTMYPYSNVVNEAGMNGVSINMNLLSLLTQLKTSHTFPWIKQSDLIV